MDFLSFAAQPTIRARRQREEGVNFTTGCAETKEGQRFDKVSNLSRNIWIATILVIDARTGIKSVMSMGSISIFCTRRFAHRRRILIDA